MKCSEREKRAGMKNIFALSDIRGEYVRPAGVRACVCACARELV